MTNLLLMSQYLHFSDGEKIEATEEALRHKAEQLQLLLYNYLDINSDLDSDAYIARGNGFCDTKYSDDFVDGQIKKLQQKLAECKKMLSLQFIS